MSFTAFQRDLRYALRSLFRRPGFLVTVVLTLALGLGVNAAIFGLFHQALMKPLPVPQPERLVNLESPGPRQGWNTSNNSGDRVSLFNYPMFRDLEAAGEGRIRLAGHRAESVNVSWQGDTRNVQGSLVSGGYFEALGLVPALGRLLSPQDDAVAGHADAVVLSHDFWRDSFGADPGVIGQTVRVNSLPLTVVGIAPRGFAGTTLGDRIDLFVPISVKWPGHTDGLPEHQRRDYYWVYVFGRLEPGTGMAQAREALQARYRSVTLDIEAALQEGMSDRALEEFRARELVLRPGAKGQSRVPATLVTPLTTLMLVSALVLLVACLNIANLQLARGAGRAGEMAVRSALGAGSGQLQRQLLLESVLLALAGAVFALPASWLVQRALSTFDGTGIALATDGGPSAATFVFTFLVALLTAAVFGLYPAWRLSRTRPAEALRARNGQGGGDRGNGGFRNGLAVVQIAFSLALLAVAGLFARSLDNIARVDLGMRVDNVVTFTVVPALNGYGDAQSRQLFERMQERLSALPGVEGVALSAVNLMAGHEWGASLTVQGYEPPPDEPAATTRNDVGSAFFDTLGIPVLAGRVFDARDGADSPRVAVVNNTFAQRFGLGADAVGRRVSLSSGDPDPDIEIVGVVADSGYSNVKDDIKPLLYQPLAQAGNAGHVNVYVRAAMDASMVSGPVREAMRALDAELPLLRMRSFSEQIGQNIGTDRLVGLLSSGFAVLATLLAAVGLYGLLSYTVAQRTPELGLRLALGSSPARLRGMVLAQIGRLAAIGIPLGLLLAVALGHAARSLLFGLSGHDPLVLASATVLLALVVVAAAWWPAGRAARTDPMGALRNE